jgi:predicted metal-dependent hydrolase
VPHSSFLTFELEGETLPIHIRRSKRKTLSLLVHPGAEVECRIPQSCSLPVLESYLDSKRAWLSKAVEEMRRVAKPRARELVDGGSARWLGHWRDVHIKSGRAQMVVLDESEGFFLTVKDQDDLPKIARLFDHWTKGQAERLFRFETGRLVQLFGAPSPRSIGVRKMTRRWGSCSSRGDILVNVALIEQPIAAIEYVLWHELCHLTHWDHSSAFWAHLAAKMPDWRERKALLG